MGLFDSIFGSSTTKVENTTVLPPHIEAASKPPAAPLNETPLPVVSADEVGGSSLTGTPAATASWRCS